MICSHCRRSLRWRQPETPAGSDATKSNAVVAARKNSPKEEEVEEEEENSIPFVRRDVDVIVFVVFRESDDFSFLVRRKEEETSSPLCIREEEEEEEERKKEEDTLRLCRSESHPDSLVVVVVANEALLRMIASKEGEVAQSSPEVVESPTVSIIIEGSGEAPGSRPTSTLRRASRR